MLDLTLDADLIALIGPPGCGKGTSISHIIQPYCDKHNRNMIKIPISEMLNAYLDLMPPAEGAFFRRMMMKGQLLPDEIANKVLIEAVRKLEKVERAVYVIDGSPRTFGQIESTLIMAPNILGIPKKRRLAVRFSTRAALCGFRARGRERSDEDINEDVFQTRWNEYETKTRPAIHTLEKSHTELGVILREIDGAYIKSSPELYQDILFGSNGD